MMNVYRHIVFDSPASYSADYLIASISYTPLRRHDSVACGSRLRDSLYSIILCRLMIGKRFENAIISI